MFSQRFRLHRSVYLIAALTLAFVLASPPVSAAAPEAPAPMELLLNTETSATLLVEAREEGTFFVEVVAVENDQGLPVLELRFAFRAAGSAPSDPFDKDVDPWDDDLDDRKPPQGGGHPVVLEVESLNGDDAGYALTLRRPSRP